MKILKSLSREAFKERFGTKTACMEYLAEMKWSEGYNCRRCNNSTSSRGKQLISKRCKSCGYDESATSHTLFHKLKFGIDKAFEMLYEITTSKKGANSIWLAERFGVNQKTAWLFRQKVLEAMESSKNYPLTGEVHVDEFEIGTPKEDKPGRSKCEDKARVVIAVEVRDDEVGRAYAQVIGDFSTESLSMIFEDHISLDAQVVTDGWSGYKPLGKKYVNFQQVLSNKGKSMPLLHIQIRNFKNWLRGVHSYCSAEYLQKYLNEYFYRFNRRNNRSNILDNILERCVFHEPVTAKMIRGYAL
jgi:hypothetical protein